MDEDRLREVLKAHQLRGFDPRGEVVHSAGWCTCRRFSMGSGRTAPQALEDWLDHVMAAIRGSALIEAH